MAAGVGGYAMSDQPNASTQSSPSTGEALPPPRRIAVTGGSGHFGSEMIELLLADPEIEAVHCLDVVPPRITHDKLEYAKADVRDQAGLERLFEGIDTVVHLAFLIARYRPKELYEGINIEGSKNVCRAAVAAGVTQLVYASSVAAYGLVRSHPLPILEDSPRVHQPDFSYNDAKWRVENFMDEFEQEHPLPIITRMRMVTALGPGQKSTIGNLLAKGYIPSTSNVPWSIVWEEDVADALVLAVKKRARGAFNLSSDESMSGKELAEACGMRSLRFPRWLGVAGSHLSGLAEKLGMGNAVDPAWMKYSDAILVLSSEKAIRELGWKRRCNTAVEVMRKVRETVAERE